MSIGRRTSKACQDLRTISIGSEQLPSVLAISWHASAECMKHVFTLLLHTTSALLKCLDFERIRCGKAGRDMTQLRLMTNQPVQQSYRNCMSAL